MLRSSLWMSALAFLVVCTMSKPALAVKAFPTDGSLQILMAEKLEKPYSKDDNYVYSKSPSFTRWVYSPWAQPEFKDDSLTLKVSEGAEKRSILISEISVESDHLNPLKSYEITLKNSYSCDAGEAGEAGCRLRLMVRCYGKTAKDDWGVTFEKTQKYEKANDGTIDLDKSILKGKDCQQGIHISAEATLHPKAKKYAFKDLQVGLTEL